MDVKSRTIEVDARTAELLEARASARGFSVAELIAELAWSSETLPPELQQMRADGEGPWSLQSLAEDARRYAEFQRTREGARWHDVKVWMQSWGTADELPSPKPRKL
jgi:hypothetical protein